MYCTNCGAKNDDQTKFCTQCGTKLGQTPAESPASEFPAGEPMPKKRRSFKFAYILAAVLILVSCAVMARNSIYRTVAPKAYVGSVFSKTLSQIFDEINKSKKELTGFTLSEKDDFTLDLSGIVNSASTDIAYMKLDILEDSGINTTISVDKNNKQMLGNFQLLVKNEPMYSVNAFLNDEEIGVNIPELFDKYWTAKTVSFGEDWNDSDFRDIMDFMDLPDDLNISFSNIMDKTKRGLTEETKKEMTKTTKKLVKNSKLGKMTSTNITIEGKSVKAREIPINIPGSEFKSYLIDMIELFFEDENIKNQISLTSDYDDFTDELDETLDDLKEYVDIAGDITIELAEYKGIIARMAVEKEFEIDDGECTLALEVRFGNNKALINDFDVELEIEGDDISLIAVELSSEGNHIPLKGSFTDSTRLTVRLPFSGKWVFDNECDINLKKRTIDGFSEIKAKNSIRLDYSGEYSNSDGLKVSLSDVDITLVDSGNTSKISGNINISFEKGAKKDLINITEKQYVLDMDEDEFYDYIEDENVYERVNEIEERIYEIARESY